MHIISCVSIVCNVCLSMRLFMSYLACTVSAASVCPWACLSLTLREQYLLRLSVYGLVWVLPWVHSICCVCLSMSLFESYLACTVSAASVCLWACLSLSYSTWRLLFSSSRSWIMFSSSVRWSVSMDNRICIGDFNCKHRQGKGVTTCVWNKNWIVLCHQ